MKSTMTFDIDRGRLASLASDEINLALAYGAASGHAEPLKALGAPRPSLDSRLDMAVEHGVGVAAAALGAVVTDFEGTARLRVKVALTFNRALKGAIGKAIDTLIICVAASWWLEHLGVDASAQQRRSNEATLLIDRLINERVRPQ